MGDMRLAEARALAESVEDLALSLDGGAYADTVLAQLGDIHRTTAQISLSESLRYYRQAALIAAKDGITLRSVPHIAGVAAAWLHLGDLDAAYTWYMQAYEGIKDTGDPTRRAELCGNIGSLCYIMREYEEALRWYDEALLLADLAGDERTIGISLMNRANVFVKRKEFDRALLEYGEARKRLKEGDPLLITIEAHESAAKSRQEEASRTPRAAATT